MPISPYKTWLCLLLLSAIFSCATKRAANPTSISGLHFLGEYTLPHKMMFEGTTVGGLSGIDYNPVKDEYYLICDDRSDLQPARFYTAKILVRESGIDTVLLTAVTTLLDAKGSPFPNKLRDSLHVPDPEALRFYPEGQLFAWSSEGERNVQKEKRILEDPAIYLSNLTGRVVDSFALPANLRMQAVEKGPRRNGVLEGLALSPDHQTLFASVEEPLYEDGPRAGLEDSSAWIRLLRFDVQAKKQVAQYAYRIDPVSEAPVPAGAFKVNGVPDVLALNAHQLLVTERSFSTGKPTCRVQVYLAELEGVEDIAGVASLKENPPVRPVRKRLLFDFNSLQRWVDNVEGASLGPRLPNGKPSLLFVTDDNFDPKERTQFFLFELQ